MKITKKKIVLSALTLLVGTALAGSISGTIAWYQYSTRANGAYIGTSGGTSGNLQLRIKGTQKWLSRLTKEDVADYLAAEGYASDIQPITSGAMDKDGALPENFYRNPILGKKDYANWEKADKTNYVFLPLELRFVERDGVRENGKDDKNIEKNVYLSDLLIKEDKDNASGMDLSDAIRFHVASYSGELVDPTPAQKSNFLISKNGGTTLTHGNLDLDGDGEADKAYADVDDPYGFEGSDFDVVDYGNGEQVAFAAKDDGALLSGEYYEENSETPVQEDNIYPILAKTNDENLDLENLKYAGESGEFDKSLGKTLASEDKFLNVDITIWVEGWQKFVALDDAGDSTTKLSSIWDSKYIDSTFDVGFQFAVDPAE